MIRFVFLEKWRTHQPFLKKNPPLKWKSFWYQKALPFFFLQSNGQKFQTLFCDLPSLPKRTTGSLKNKAFDQLPCRKCQNMQRWRRQIGAKVVTEHFSHFDSSAKPQKIPNKLENAYFRSIFLDFLDLLDLLDLLNLFGLFGPLIILNLLDHLELLDLCWKCLLGLPFLSSVADRG